MRGDNIDVWQTGEDERRSGRDLLCYSLESLKKITEALMIADKAAQTPFRYL
jgi:hypothetical protein